MREKLAEIIRLYGQEMTLVRRKTGEERTVLAFLQPLLKEREDLPATATPLGAVSDQRWLYIGPVEQELEPGDQVRFQGMPLAAQEAMRVCFRRETLYCRAILRREKEAAE